MKKALQEVRRPAGRASGDGRVSVRRGRPRKDGGQEAAGYVSKTFRISAESAVLLDDIAYSRGMLLKDVLEEAVGLLYEKYSPALLENARRKLSEYSHARIV